MNYSYTYSDSGANKSISDPAASWHGRIDSSCLIIISDLERRHTAKSLMALLKFTILDRMLHLMLLQQA